MRCDVNEPQALQSPNNVPFSFPKSSINISEVHNWRLSSFTAVENSPFMELSSEKERDEVDGAEGKWSDVHGYKFLGSSSSATDCEIQEGRVITRNRVTWRGKVIEC